MTLTPGTPTTAIVILAPHSVQTIAVPLLHQYAPDALLRVPAHLTVLFPFVPPERLDDASHKVSKICSDMAPFEVTMSGYGFFPNVAFMSPVDHEPIKAVFRRIYAVFPECPPYGGDFGEDLHPHMTVGVFATEAEREAVVLPDYEPITFRVDRLHILQGIAKAALPWITHDIIPLGASENAHGSGLR